MTSGSGSHPSSSDSSNLATYADAGVNLVGAESLVNSIKGLVGSTRRNGVVGDVGGFAGLFSLGSLGYRHPVLAASTDGVGTKILIARATGRYDTIGLDLVAMCVDDLACVGAEPLFLLDYIATGRLDSEKLEALLSGVAEGCRQAGCALLGGETAEHPGAMADDDLDVAGFAVGVFERGQELGPHRVRSKDVLIGLPSPGLRSNGYSLARQVLIERAELPLDGPAWAHADHTLADELLRPSIIYVPAVRAAIAAASAPQDGSVTEGSVQEGSVQEGSVQEGSVQEGSVHACAHITGGGIPGNLARVLPPHLDAFVDASTWQTPRIFEEISRLGPVSDDEMASVFNMGIGMVLVVDQTAAEDVMSAVRGHGHEPVVIGSIVEGSAKVRDR